MATEYYDEPEYPTFFDAKIDSIKFWLRPGDHERLYRLWKADNILITTRPPFEDSDIYKHETLTFAYRAQSMISRNPIQYNFDHAERQEIMQSWLNELLPAVDSYRATLKILKAAYERGEL